MIYVNLSVTFSINGIPACANSRLLTEVLRKEWNFTGYVVSDEGAIEFSLTKHKYFTDPVDVVATCVNAGCNLELSGNISKPYYLYMSKAIIIVHIYVLESNNQGIYVIFSY